MTVGGEQAARRCTTPILESEAKRLLQQAGINVPRGIEASTAEEAGQRARELRFPVVVKILARGLSHKSDVGGVRIGLDDPAGVTRAAEDVLSSVAGADPAVAGHGLLVEEMVPPGSELLIGTSQDPTFGSLIALGIGGVLTELFGDVAFRAVPLERWDPFEMMDELGGAQLLFEGYRDFPAVDPQELAELLITIGGPDGLLRRGALRSLELNPVIVTSEGLVAVDAVAEVEG